jgi:hypothetical protein
MNRDGIFAFVWRVNHPTFCDWFDLPSLGFQLLEK